MARRRSNTPRWRGRSNLPPFEAGDLVYPTYKYPGWSPTEARRIEAVTYNEFSDEWTCRIWNPHKKFYGTGVPNHVGGYSEYNPANLAKEAPRMAKRKQYYGQQVMGDARIPSTGPSTILCDSYAEAEAKVKASISEGERWLILSIESEVRGLPPRPPVTVERFS